MYLSVALCTYHGAKFLPAQLASLATQTRLPDELVVCDDRSSDTTPDILAEFARTAPFPVRWSVNEQNLRSTKNFERAIGRCTGDIIFLCDQDDVWLPHKLERFESTFARHPDVTLVASDLEAVASDLSPLGYNMWANLPFPAALQTRIESADGWRALLRYNVVTGAAAAFRAELRSRIFPIPPCWVHDGWIAFLASITGRLKFIPEPLTRYRQHTAQQIGVQPLSLSRQVTFARLRNAAYFGQLGECFESLAAHLTGIRQELHDERVIAACQARAAHARVQQKMRLGSRLGRFFPAVGELMKGNYHRYGLGFKAFAADLLL